MNDPLYATRTYADPKSQAARDRWLMVSPKTAQNYAKLGPSGPAQRAILMALEFGLQRSGLVSG